MKPQVLLLSFLSLMISFLQAQEFARGVDIGWLSEMENSGRIWRDSTGVQKDVLDIFPDYCINSIRLRVWVDPNGGWSGKEDVIAMAKRVHSKGYRLMIDFHYSDSWADPGQQNKPAAWSNYSIQDIQQAIYDHTTDVLSALKDEGITPEWVQVGNETNDGMLWPEGRASSNNNANMSIYASYVDRGYEAVKAIFPTTQVIVHVANGYDNGLFRWNIGGLIANGARFDIIAMSMYPDTPNDWPQYAQDALSNAQDMINRYGKPVMVAEIGLATNAPSDARQFVEQVISNMESLGENGLGVFWWEPQAYDWRGYGKVAWYGNYGATPYQPTEAMNGFQTTDCLVTNKDCNGVNAGTAFIDDCGICVGGNTNRIACSGLIEAETACSIDGIQLESTNEGYSGQGYANTDNFQGASVTWIINSDFAKQTTLTFRYANGGTDARDASIAINGIESGTLSLPSTGSWTTWGESSIEVNLKESLNDVSLSATTPDGLANIDAIFLQEGISDGECTPILGLDHNGEHSIQLFPNPTSNKLYLNKSVDWELYSLQGMLIMDGRSSSIDLMGLSAGLYLLTSENKSFKVQKR